MNRVDDLEEANVLLRNLDLDLMVTPERLGDEIKYLDVQISDRMENKMATMAANLHGRNNEVMDKCLAVVKERVSRRDFVDHINHIFGEIRE